MSDPWDIPAFPQKGDDDQDSTFAGIGRVLSQWETIEVELSYLYALFMNRPEDLETIRAYGKGLIFDHRVKDLMAAAETYFRGNPHQDTEGELSELIFRIRSFSARRNDVAHSIVRPFEWIKPCGSDATGPLQFCAAPPHYNARKFDLANMPVFAYSSIELNALHIALFAVCEDAQKLKLKLMLGEDGAPSKPQ